MGRTSRGWPGDSWIFDLSSKGEFFRVRIKTHSTVKNSEQSGPQYEILRAPILHTYKDIGDIEIFQNSPNDAPDLLLTGRIP